MSGSAAKRSWWSFLWLAGWSWTERAIITLPALAAIVALLVAGRRGGWIAGAFLLLSLLALHLIVRRHGGWHLLGPHYFYDVVRLARRGRTTVLRVFYVLAMLIGLAWVYEASPIIRPNDFAKVSEDFAFALFLVQNLAVLILTPAYVGSAISEEKERRTLEILFTTHLNNTEIVLGKLFSRTIHLVGFVLAGFPILSLMQFWGGIDIVLIAGNVLNTLLNILSIGSLCLFFSALTKTVSSSVMMSYAVVLPMGLCCGISLGGFPFVLQDARISGGRVNVTVQDLGALAVAHLIVTVICLALAIVAVREQEPFSPVSSDAAGGKPESDPITTGRRMAADAMMSAVQSGTAHALAPPAPLPPRPEDPLDDFSIPYTLPPMADNALWWKERFLGGPPFVMSPIALVPAIPFVATGFMVMVVMLLHTLYSSPDQYQMAIVSWSVVLRFFFCVFFGCYLLGVCYRATTTVARERQQQTLEPLLLLPVERSEILRAKWLGSLWRGWPWLVLLVTDLVIGTFIGAFHPFSAILLGLGTIPLLVFFTSLGLYISVTASTVLRANLVMVVILVLFAASTLAAMMSRNAFAYHERFAFTYWERPDLDLERSLVIAGLLAMYLIGGLVFWLLALRKFEDRASDTSV